MSEWDQPEKNNLKFLVILENTGVVKFSQVKVVLKITLKMQSKPLWEYVKVWKEDRWYSINNLYQESDDDEF